MLVAAYTLSAGVSGFIAAFFLIIIHDMKDNGCLQNISSVNEVKYKSILLKKPGVKGKTRHLFLFLIK